MTRKRQKLFIGCGSGLALLLVVGALLSHHAIANQLNAWKLLPRPERLTELYFTDHSHVPTTYTPGNVQSVAFTIHNLEYRSTTYTYKIIQRNQDGSQKQELASGHLTLTQNSYAKPIIPITLGDEGSRSQVSVELSSGESIDYWITWNNGGSNSATSNGGGTT